MHRLEGLFAGFAAVTPSDSARLSCRGIWVGGAGTIALSIDGTTAAVTLSGVPAGTLLPIALEAGRIMNTGTSATLIVALQ